MLVKEFGRDSDIDALLSRREEKKELIKAQAKKEEEARIQNIPEEIKTEIPESIKPHVQVVDKIDLDALNRPKKVEVKPEPEEEKAPVEKTPEIEIPEVKTPEADVPEVKVPEVEKPVEEEVHTKQTVEEKVKEEPVFVNKEETIVEKKPEHKVETTEALPPQKETEEKQDNVFRLNKATIKSNIVVKGSIDLSSINDKTRPAKKTKAEKKKERLEKEMQDQKKVKENTVRLLKKETDEEAKKRKANADNDDAAKKKRNRIKKGKVDIEKGAFPQGGGGQPHSSGKPQKNKKM